MEKPKLVKNWKELAEVPDSQTHTLKIEDGSGWIYKKEPHEMEEYLSTHTFYGSTYERSTELLQSYGFNIELDNWDAK